MRGQACCIPLLLAPSRFPTWQCQLLRVDLPETKASCVEVSLYCAAKGSAEVTV